MLMSWHTVCLGTRYNPCSWTDAACHLRVEHQIAEHKPIPGIVGHHKFSGTWLKAITGTDEPAHGTHVSMALLGLACVASAAVCYNALRRRGSGSIVDMWRVGARGRFSTQRPLS